MNAGFSNFDFLKKQLLADSLKDDLSFNDQITAVGLGAAGMFEKYCNRKFMRVVGQQDVFPADRAEFLLSKLPVETVTLAEKKRNEVEGFCALPARFIRIIDQANGIITHGECDAGRYFEQIRITYTGGYWWDTSEPGKPGYPCVIPATAAPLPDSLLLAWILQCKHIWKNIDKLGSEILSDGGVKSLRFPEDYAPTVKDTLNLFVRYNLV